MKKLLLSGILLIIWVNISRSQASWGTKIGCTYYELQTNSAIRNGLIRNVDGTMAVVWIQNHSFVEPQPDPADRGIGYNYYDGVSWVYLNNLPAFPCSEGECGIPHGCASDYIGWPNIVHCASGMEVVISHFKGIGIGGLSLTGRTAQGSGTWDTTGLLGFDTTVAGGNLWPRAVGDGNFIHVIASSNNGVWNGVTKPIVYHRSPDCGATWDITNYMLPGIDTSLFDALGADSYAIDARGGTVAVTAGGWGEPWVLWKSTSNGDTGTWSQTIIALFDTTGTQWFNDSTGATWTYDKAHAVTLDNNGMAHASTGQIVVQVDSMGKPSGIFFPLWDTALYYWNENMAAPLIAGGLVDLPDWNTGDSADGDPSSGLGNDFPNYYVGVASMSQISVDQNNDPYIVYAGMVEWTSNTGDTSGQSFRDLYLVYSKDGGATWSMPINIAGEIAGANDGSSGTGFEEDVYPMTNKIIGADNMLHVVWQVDSDPGIELPCQNICWLPYIMYYGIDLDSLPTSIPKDQNAFPVSDFSIYPNPMNTETTITILNPEFSNLNNLNITLYDILGRKQNVSYNISKLKDGAAEIKVKKGNLLPGIYYFKILSFETPLGTGKIVIGN